jgi:hypothetical protein
MSLKNRINAAILPNDVKKVLNDLLDLLPAFGRQGAPATATGDATLTAAQMTAGILVGTPTAAAAYTMLTGAQFEAALRLLNPDLAVGDSIELTIINLGGTGDDITLTAPASGITIVGNAVVGPVADVATEQEAQGTFRFRRTATDTFVAYRVS